jgi:hypothetical protein
MIELICFVKRKEGMDRDAFHEHWLNNHGPLIRNTPELSKYVLRYEQNHRTDRDSERDRGSAGHDGVTIQWFENMQAFIGFCTDPAYHELIAPDEAKFLDRSAFHMFFAAEPIVQMPVRKEHSDGGVKLLCMIPRAKTRSAESFHAHWTGPHAAIFRDSSELSRHILGYRQYPRLVADYERKGDPQFDGLTEQFFESEDAFWEFAQEPDYRDKVAPDEDTLLIRKGLNFILTRQADIIIEE